MSSCRKTSTAKCEATDQPPTEIKRILLVDGQTACLMTTKWFLSTFGYAVDTARNTEEALGLFDATRHNAVITENHLPTITGTEMSQQIKARSPNTPIVMYTAFTPSDVSHVDQVIERPTHLMVLKDVLDNLLNSPRV